MSARRGWWLLFLLPALVLALNAGTAYWLDIEEFGRWARHVRRGSPLPPPINPVFADTYLNTGCNYPPLGAIVTAGAVRLLESARNTVGVDVSIAQAFRGYLSLFEIVSLVLTFALFRALSVRHAALATAGLYLLPSSWTGGAVWGQIDVITHVFLLLAAYSFVSVIVEERPRPRRDLVWMAIGAAAVSSALLVKQLAIFSLPGLASLLVVGLVAIRYRHGARTFLATSVVGLASGGGLFLVLDRALFAPPPGYASLSAYVWTEGSWHSRYLFANGPNVWTFLSDRNLSPADVPVYAGLTAREAGLTAAGGACVILGLVFMIHALAMLSQRRRFEANRRTLAATHLAFIGLINLIVPLLVTGTHERYFFHAFPFLLIGLAGWRVARSDTAPPASIHAAAAAGFVTGCFVFSIMKPDAFGPLLFLRSQVFTASVLLAAATVLCLGFCDGLLRLIVLRDSSPKAEPLPHSS